MGTQIAEMREARLAAVHAQLAESVGALVTDEDWKRALEFAARFRSRSFPNVLLIRQAHGEAFEQGRVPSPTPTYVPGTGSGRRWAVWCAAGRRSTRSWPRSSRAKRRQARARLPAGGGVWGSRRSPHPGRFCGPGSPARWPTSGTCP